MKRGSICICVLIRLNHKTTKKGITVAVNMRGLCVCVCARACARLPKDYLKQVGSRNEESNLLVDREARLFSPPHAVFHLVNDVYTSAPHMWVECERLPIHDLETCTQRARTRTRTHLGHAHAHAHAHARAHTRYTHAHTRARTNTDVPY
jgi:hypothetical protein